MSRASRACVAIAALMLGGSLAEAALVSGPGGGAAPMLTVTPVDTKEAPYCVTCQADTNPTVVVFTSKNDEATQKLIAELAKQVETRREQHLVATVVLLGTVEQNSGLVAYAREQKLILPLATTALDSTELKDWKLNPRATTTTVFINQHKVHHSVADLKATKLSKQIDVLLTTSRNADPDDPEHGHNGQDHGMGGCHM